MRREIKHDLDASVPKYIMLDETKKTVILQEAHKRIETMQSSPKPIVKPILASVAVVGLAGFIAFPYVQQELQQHASQEAIIANAIQQVTIRDVNYPNLIRAVFVDNTNEMIYTDGKGIYAFSIGSNTKRILVESNDEAIISGVTVAANEEWIAWSEGVSTYILNRMNGEIKEIVDTFGTLQLAGNRLIYMAFHDATVGEEQIDLLTFEKARIHELSGEGSHSTPGINDGKIAISERVSEEAGGGTSFTIYDLEKNSQIGIYTLPYERVENVTITDNKVYASLSNEDGSSTILGYINLDDGQFYKIKVPEFDAFAIYENYLALSIPVKDSNTVKLFAIENDKAEPLPYLNQIKERLVKPRFTDEGMLVLNGEGPDRSMYLVDVKMLD